MLGGRYWRKVGKKDMDRKMVIHKKILDTLKLPYSVACMMGYGIYIIVVFTFMLLKSIWTDGWRYKNGD